MAQSRFGPSEREIRSQINDLVNKLGRPDQVDMVNKHDTTKKGKLTFIAIGLSDLELAELVLTMENTYDIQIPDMLCSDARFGPDDIIELIFLNNL